MAALPNSLLALTLTSNFGTFILYGLSCLLCIVAYHKRQDQNSSCTPHPRLRPDRQPDLHGLLPRRPVLQPRHQDGAIDRAGHRRSSGAFTERSTSSAPPRPRASGLSGIKTSTSHRQRVDQRIISGWILSPASYERLGRETTQSSFSAGLSISLKGSAPSAAQLAARCLMRRRTC